MRLTPEQIEATRQAMCIHTHPDGRPNAEQMARHLGLAPSTVKNRLRVLAASSPDMDNVQSAEVIPFSKPKYRGVPWSWQKPAANDDGEAIRVCVIGDLHVSPGQDLSRLRWIARHIKETQPDHIVQIGDWSTFDSVSTHDPIGSVKAKHRPSLRQDLEAHHESLAVFDRELGPSVIPRTVTLGNHCDRVRKYEELRGELEGSVWHEVLDSFAQFRWKTYPFGEVVFIGGCGFVHVPLNRIGKPHSSPNIMANNLAHDLIKGHSHVATYLTIPKIGQDTGVTLIDVGTSLPHGHVESYAKLSQTSWWWGIHDVIIRNGRIDDFARVSMKTLESRYL